MMSCCRINHPFISDRTKKNSEKLNPFRRAQRVRTLPNRRTGINWMRSMICVSPISCLSICQVVIESKCFSHVRWKVSFVIELAPLYRGFSPIVPDFRCRMAFCDLVFVLNHHHYYYYLNVNSTLDITCGVPRACHCVSMHVHRLVWLDMVAASPAQLRAH